MNTVVIVALVVLLAFISTLVGKQTHMKPSAQYHYRRKDFIMTKAENDFFDVINRAVGNNYYVFPQVHLSEFLDHRVKNGQNWQHALHYINQKSVDYVVCDKQYRRPLLAIELDDWSHNSELRRERDANVERILQEAGIPLLRFKDVGTLQAGEVASRLQSALSAGSTSSH